MKNPRLILIAIAAGMIIVILIGVLSVLLNVKKLDLSNIDQVDTGLSTSEVSELEGFIWQSLKNTQGFDDNKTEIKALVRPSSLTIAEKDGIISYDFLVDIDEFKATYKVSFALMKGKGFYESPLVECPTPDQMKYAGVECRGEKTSTLTVTVGKSLPYYFNLGTGELVTVTRSIDDAGDDYLQVRVSSCGDAAVVSAARQGVKEWISSLGYAPDKYKIEIPEFCDGGH